MPYLTELTELAEVVMVNLVLSGDNAIVVAMAAAGLPAAQRGKAMIFGLGAATALRVIFALAASKMFAYLGLRLIGGLLLLWVCWKLWRELRDQGREDAAIGELEEEVAEVLPTADFNQLTHNPGPSPRKSTKTLGQALTQIMIADISMSLDNVLAVAAAAHDHPWILILGLVLSVGFMGAAAALIAGLLKRYHWLGYVGLAIIFVVACQLIWQGTPVMMDAADQAGLM
jgi:YjbE family integral membrane protein